jgi:hypothetical protein
MLKTLGMVWALLLIGAFFITATAGASSGGDMVIPMDRYVNLSNGLIIHLEQVTISDLSLYSTYSPDNANTTWILLVFHYEYYGKHQVACRFHVQIVDDTGTVPAGWRYDKTDETIYKPLYPNEVSSTMTLEFAMPKDRRLTKLIVIDDALKAVSAELPIDYSMHVPSQTSPSLPEIIFEEEGKDLRTLMIIPILLGIVGLIGWFMARRKLF